MKLRDLRHGLGLNQKQFWTAFGLGQSAGSRYETGRRLPGPIRKLIRSTCGWGKKKTVLARMKRIRSL